MTVSEERKKEWQDQVDFILEHGEGNLTEWETDFADSISKQLSNKKELSFKQSSVLRKIAIKLSEKL
jgi:hypothetical protein